MRGSKVWGAAAAAALLLAACGGSSGGGPSQLGALNHHVDVQFWEAMAGGALKPTLEQLTSDFNASQPNVTVHLQVYPDYGTLRTKTLAALAAGSPPDLSQAYPDWAAKYQQSSALADLTPYVSAKDGLSASDLKDIWSSLLESGKVGGKQYMLPFNKSVNVLYYNPTLFAQAGISDPPKTWDEFAADAKKLTGGDHWGTDASNSLETIFEGQIRDYGGTLLSADGKKATFNSDAGVKALQVWIDMAQKDKSAHLLNGYDDADYGSGHEAMSIGTIAGYSYKQKAIGSRFQMTTAGLPGGPSGEHDLIQGTNLVVFSHAGKDVQQGAFQYIKYLLSKSATETWSEKTGYMPVRKSAYEDMKQSFYPQNSILQVAPAQLPTAVSTPSVSFWQEASGDLAIELANAVSGKKSAKQALDDAAKQVNDLAAQS